MNSIIRLMVIISLATLCSLAFGFSGSDYSVTLQASQQTFGVGAQNVQFSWTATVALLQGQGNISGGIVTLIRTDCTPNVSWTFPNTTNSNGVSVMNENELFDGQHTYGEYYTDGTIPNAVGTYTYEARIQRTNGVYVYSNTVTITGGGRPDSPACGLRFLRQRESFEPNPIELYGISRRDG